MPFSSRIKEYTDRLEQQGLVRRRTLCKPEGSTLVHFDSNDYLSFAQDPKISAAYQRGYALYPSGSGASMLLSGYHTEHKAVEEAFADLLGVDECILFSSGYAANLAVTAVLGQLKISCLIDKEIHASVYDGLTLSQVNYQRYVHNNWQDLKKKLTPHSAVLTEGTFSMSGQSAPLDHYSSLCTGNHSVLVVDEAHSFGVLGEQGKGAVASHGLTQNEVPLRVISFGKACGGQGAVVAGKADWIVALLQAGRSVIYSTALSPALSYGLLNTLDYVVQADERRTKLAHLVDLVRSLIKNSPLTWADSQSPIQQVQLGCPRLALYYAQELKKRGISCFAIRKPTVSTKASGLRIILNYNHTPEQIYDLFAQLKLIYEHQCLETR